MTLFIHILFTPKELLVVHTDSLTEQIPARVHSTNTVLMIFTVHKSVMHDQSIAMHHAWLLSVHHVVNHTSQALTMQPVGVRKGDHKTRRVDDTVFMFC